MQPETRQCQNCKTNFRIEPEDFLFYEKMKVPPPMWCPECRFRRRLLFRNERTLYRRKCMACGREMISMYAPYASSDSSPPVYCQECWWSDRWDPMRHGREYDFSRPFFAQLRELWTEVPHLNLVTVGRRKNSAFANIIENVANCYLTYEATDCDSIFYSGYMDACRNVFDSFKSWDVEHSSMMTNSTNCYGSHYVRESHQCLESSFLEHCAAIEHCFGCVNLRHKSFHIFNRPFEESAYYQRVKGFNTGSFSRYEKIREQFEVFALTYPRKPTHNRQCVDVVGDFLTKGAHNRHCFAGEGLLWSKFTYWSGEGSYMYDASGCGFGAELLYECQSVFRGAGTVRFSSFCFREVVDLTYCSFVTFGSHLFGCVGSRNKSYCILNKQYTKDEYEALVPKIIQHMNEMPYVDQKGRTYRYGEFFPPELSPWAYNETIAQEYFPLTKARAIEQGYLWRDPEQRRYAVTILPENLPDHINDVSDSILQDTIGCLHQGTCQDQCATAFKIIPQELQFYRTMNLPLPRLCPNCRHYQRIKQRNPLKLWHRQCQCAGTHSSNNIYTNQAVHPHGTASCPNEFETSYAPDRPEIVYCEECYNAEVV